MILFSTYKNNAKNKYCILKIRLQLLIIALNKKMPRKKILSFNNFFCEEKCETLTQNEIVQSRVYTYLYINRLYILVNKVIYK